MKKTPRWGLDFAQDTHAFDLAIMVNPTMLEVVSAHKGDFWLELETCGKAAHGSRPELGQNAVKAMAKVVVALETEYAATLRNHQHPLLGNATINVGVIQGGSQPNVVPDRCKVQVDRRTLPGEKLKVVMADISRVARHVGVKAECARYCHAYACIGDDHEFRCPRLLGDVGNRQTVGCRHFCDAGRVIAKRRDTLHSLWSGNIAQVTQQRVLSVASLI